MDGFTKGPWKADGAIVTIGDEWKIYQRTAKEYAPICQICDESLANAQLMAAAPDMYEACKSMIDAFGGLPGGLPDSTFTEPYFLMRKALAKAGG